MSFRPASWLFAFALPWTAAQAEIHKCPDRNGMPVYQNFACGLDSPGAEPVAGEPAATGGAGGRPTAHAKGSSASNDRGPGATRAGRPPVPRAGMTMQQVRLLWGEPIEATTEEHAQDDVEVWSYAGARSVRFDRKGRVTTVRW